MAPTIASLIVRGLRDNTKRREMFTWNIFQCICYKRSIALKTLITYGLQNGVTKLFLAATRANKVWVCILFNNNFDFQIKKVFIDPQKDALLSATLKPVKTF